MPVCHCQSGNRLTSKAGAAISVWLFMDSRLVRIFCANLPSQQARGAAYNLLLLLRKGYLFRHRSSCYRLSSSSTSLESIKSLRFYTWYDRIMRPEVLAAACARARGKRRGIINSERSLILIPKLIRPVNGQVRGWANYFGNGQSRPAFRAMNWFLQHRLVRHLRGCLKTNPLILNR
ncbi:group II intron maturase-specific domain-containing protein [Candidatus Thiosymbion oneisti]|uniref:group II intron maturase-specific domain-containing protein n=1 Tax=Candidatus Thiosymbion oneisti TaxID=589554 RepID=UPI0010611435